MNKKGQEEITGFVLIIIIVSVIFLVLIGIFIRQEVKEQQSTDVYQFLDSAMALTTSCALSYEPNYLTLGGLIEKCYSGGQCLSGEDTCDALNSTLKSVLEESWQVGEENPIRGYEFRAVWQDGETSELILEAKEGDCSGRMTGAENLADSFSGTIVSSLKICYGD